jgi:hypothetical protein
LAFILFLQHIPSRKTKGQPLHRLLPLISHGSEVSMSSMLLKVVQSQSPPATSSSSSQGNGPTSIEAHRSHDPDTNKKRSGPFQFGSRYLEAGDDVFEFNAWDHVETDDAYKEYTERQFEMQRQSPVSDFDKS